MRILLPLVLSLPTVAYAQDPTTDVLWYHGNGGSTLGAPGFNQRLQTLGGALRQESNWSNITSLSNYRFVVIARPTQTFDAQQKLDLQAFLDDFGILVLVGDSLLGATQSGIDTINDLTAALNLDMSLLPVNFTTDGTCETGEVVNSTPFLDSAAPIGTTSMGDMSVGANATVIETYSVFNPNTGQTLAFTMLAHQGLALLASDYQTFTNDTCTLPSKQAMWENIWDIYCDRDFDGFEIGLGDCQGFDCDDTDPLVGQSFQWYDLDGDGFGDGNAPAPCNVPMTVTNGDDCDDANSAVNPNAVEICDGVDNDCNNITDTDASDATDWYTDFDGDGFGREGSPERSCNAPEGKVDNAEDCDDGNAEIRPDAMESCSTSSDDDCDGTINEGCASTNPPPSTPEKPGCSIGGSELLGLPALLLAGIGLIRRRARR